MPLIKIRVLRISSRQVISKEGESDAMIIRYFLFFLFFFFIFYFYICLHPNKQSKQHPNNPQKYNFTHPSSSNLGLLSG